MKKLLVIAALISIGSTAIAFEGNKSQNAEVTYQEKAYTKIETEKVPAAILKEISEKYEGYNISAAYKSEDNEYKLEVARESTVVTVYYTATGEFVKEKK